MKRSTPSFKTRSLLPILPLGLSKRNSHRTKATSTSWDKESFSFFSLHKLHGSLQQDIQRKHQYGQVAVGQKHGRLLGIPSQGTIILTSPREIILSKGLTPAALALIRTSSGPICGMGISVISRLILFLLYWLTSYPNITGVCFRYKFNYKWL